MGTYVSTVSVYVDKVDSPEEAAEKVRSLNSNWGDEFDVEIVLPEEPSWEETLPDLTPSESPDPGWMNE